MGTFCSQLNKKTPEARGASQTNSAEVQKMFKLWLQNSLKVSTNLLLKYITFLYLPQALKSGNCVSELDDLSFSCLILLNYFHSNFGFIQWDRFIQLRPKMKESVRNVW